jgi:hypothetical protein
VEAVSSRIFTFRGGVLEPDTREKREVFVVNIDGGCWRRVGGGGGGGGI